MTVKNFVMWSSVLVLGTGMLQAQTESVEQLKQQLKQANENFEKALQEQRRVIDDLSRRLQALEKQTNQPTAAVAAPVTAPQATPEASTEAPSKPWSPTEPIRLSGGQRAYLNLSFDGLFSMGTSTASDIEELQTGGHDPNQRGFTVQNLETTFEGMVDPYFRGQANIVFQIDRHGESFLEAEEAYMETLSLPAGLQVKAGQYFAEFGRLNPTHPHTWDFVDEPLVNARFLGEDGLRGAGARVAWLAPTPFYSELYLGVMNSQGETAASFRNGNEGEPLFGRLPEEGRVKAFNDMLFVPRYAVSFNLSDSQTVLGGVSGAFGPNGTGGDTQIYGVDLFWKWKPVSHNKGFPFVAWQSEAMLRRYRADASTSVDLDGNGTLDFVPSETLTDWGFYSQILWGIRPRWVVGLRGDYVTGNQADYERLFGTDPARGTRSRVSPDLTWYPSEFSKIRLQYNYDDREGIGTDHSVWLQFEFLLGSHGAHKF